MVLHESASILKSFFKKQKRTNLERKTRKKERKMFRSYRISLPPCFVVPVPSFVVVVMAILVFSVLLLETQNVQSFVLQQPVVVVVERRGQQQHVGWNHPYDHQKLSSYHRSDTTTILYLQNQYHRREFIVNNTIRSVLVPIPLLYGATTTTTQRCNALSPNDAAEQYKKDQVFS